MEKRQGKWIVTIVAYKKNDAKRWKVTRRIPELSIAETRIFESEKDAISQFEMWSR